MPMASTPFNWRGFWADLLSGAGRGLLELDGSREAEAALTGLDYFAAMRRRHHAGRRTAIDHDGSVENFPPRSLEAMDGVNADPVETPEQRDGAFRPQSDRYRDPRGYDPVVATGGLPPRMRPVPLSADPYDHPGLPVRIRLGQRGYIDRR